MTQPQQPTTRKEVSFLLYCFEKTKAGWGNFKNFSFTMFNRSCSVVLAVNYSISTYKP
jgi:hypothetical protein